MGSHAPNQTQKEGQISETVANDARRARNARDPTLPPREVNDSAVSDEFSESRLSSASKYGRTFPNLVVEGSPTN
jgi:hypothetical protein